MLFLLHTAVLEHVLEATHRSDLYLTSTRSRTLKMPTVNYRQAITKEVRDTWDLTGISKQSITHKLKQQNKKSSAAIKSALESLLESKTIILDSNRYSIPAEERSHPTARDRQQLHTLMSTIMSGTYVAPLILRISMQQYTTHWSRQISRIHCRRSEAKNRRVRSACA